MPDGNWNGEGGHGYGDCGSKCTDVADDPSGEMPCIPAGGSFSGMSETSRRLFSGKDHPFQTCYSYLDTAKRCWSKSYYSSGVGDQAPNLPDGWYECVPKGGDDWHDLEGKLPFNYYETPCQEVHHQYP